jgi:hypothetical protein
MIDIDGWYSASEDSICRVRIERKRPVRITKAYNRKYCGRRCSKGETSIRVFQCGGFWWSVVRVDYSDKSWEEYVGICSRSEAEVDKDGQQRLGIESRKSSECYRPVDDL